MNFAELVEKRQSCRRFADRPVARELIDRCLESARLAPSACNSQPWSFIVVDREPDRSRIARAASAGIYKMSSFIAEAPALVVVKTERSVFASRLGGMLRGVQYSLIDIGIACEHIVLQAAELGIDSCWIGWFDEKGLRKALELPRTAHIDIVLALGYRRDDDPDRTKIRRALNDIRSYYPESGRD